MRTAACTPALGGAALALVIAAPVIVPSAALETLDADITMRDYVFTLPEGWHLQQRPGHILMTNPDSGCLILMLEPQLSSGDLGRDAEAAFAAMYPGWAYARQGADQYLLSRGTLPSGFEYFMIEAARSKPSADGSRYDGLEDGAALVVKAGTRILIIAVRHNPSMLGHRDCLTKYQTWRRFFNSLAIKNIVASRTRDTPTTRSLVGRWRLDTGGGIGVGECTFSANGQYACGGSLAASADSAAFQATGGGTYSLSGDQLSLRHSRASAPAVIRVRFDEVNHGGNGWTDRLCMLQADALLGGLREPCYDRGDTAH